MLCVRFVEYVNGPKQLPKNSCRLDILVLWDKWRNDWDEVLDKLARDSNFELGFRVFER